MTLRRPLDCNKRDDSPMAGHLPSKQERGVRFPRPAPTIDRSDA